jgi:hypothetical protein
MKESLSRLEQFISDFNLRQSSGVITFTATIHFSNAAAESGTVESEVHIITSDNIAAIYFLSVDGKIIPDMFSVKDHRFTYTKAKCLNIEGESYDVAVFPKTKNNVQE